MHGKNERGAGQTAPFSDVIKIDCINNFFCFFGDFPDGAANRVARSVWRNGDAFAFI
jgi:hypothetical protein